MNETTQPKSRKPFRGRRPRRPGNAEGAAPVDGAGAEGAAAGAGEFAPAPQATAESSGTGGEAQAPAGGGETAAAPAGQPQGQQQRGPRPPRPNRQGRPQNQGQGGGQNRQQQRPRQGDGQGGDFEGPPRNQQRQHEGNRQGKSKFDRNRKGGGFGGQGGQGGQNRGGNWGDQPPSGAAEHGNEYRRSGKGLQNAEPVRLATLMVKRGLCTQQEADSYLHRGWVIVNGERVRGAGTRVHPAAEIRLAPEARGEQSRGVTILLNKPVDCISGEFSGEAEAGIGRALELISGESLDDRYDGPSFSEAHLQGLRAADELGVDSLGLLVLTQDENVVRQLSGEGASLPMEYAVEVEGPVDDDGLARLGAGLEDFKPLQVARVTDRQFKFMLPPGSEGRIGSLCALVGQQTTSIKRLRIGSVRLGDVPQGKWRYLRDDESF